jgi:hypothetical protein
MKTLMMTLIAITLLSSPGFAQSVEPTPSIASGVADCNPTPPIVKLPFSHIGPASLELNHYDAIQHSIIQLGGAPFHSIQYKRKPEFAFNAKTSREEWLLFANFIGDGAMAYRFLDTTWDKEMHFIVGYELANVSNGIFQLVLPDDMKHRRLVAALLGFGVSALAGAGKEYYDSLHPQNHTVDGKDFIATALGGAVGTLTLSFDLQKALYMGRHRR